MIDRVDKKRQRDQGENIMEIIISQTFVLFAFMAIGFTLARCKIVKNEHSNFLSKLLVCVFYPANNLKALSRYCTIDYLRENYLLILASLAILTVIVLIMYFTAKLFTRDRVKRAIYEYSLVISNFGALGYAFAEELFGIEGLNNVIVFSIPLTLYTYTFGYCILSGKKFTPKNLVNPSSISLVLGILIGVTGLGTVLPNMIYSLFDKASYCMAPLCMLLVGIVIAEFGVLTMVKNPRAYIITALRLLVIPIAIGGVLSLLHVQRWILVSAILMYAMPCGMNTIVFPKNAGHDCSTGASLALISNLLACGTIPLVFYIFGIYL